MTTGSGRAAALFAVAVAGSNFCQVAWLIAGARALPHGDFGVVLTAQALYGVLQIIVDNGTSFYGARMAAQGQLEPSARFEVVQLRLVLAVATLAIGLVIAAAGGPRTLEAFAPFTLALLAFAVLNVWEDYGRGRVLPYATYLLLRSLVLAVVVGVAAVAGAHLPLPVAGACEVAAVVAVGLAYRAWTLPRGRIRLQRGTLRSVRDIGAPALITQYDFAIPTIILGVTGRTGAAAVSGVTLRLLSGLQGINGAIVAGIFPRLAQRASPQDAGARAARWAAAGIVGLSLAGLLMVGVAAALLVRGFLDADGSTQEAALVFGMGAAGAAGLVMHRGFTLVAWEQEHRLIPAALAGAAVVTVGTLVSLTVAERHSAIVAAGSFVIGQALTLLLLNRMATGEGERSRRENLLVVLAAGALPLLAALLAFAPDLRIPLAAAAAAAAAAASLRLVLLRRTAAS